MAELNTNTPESPAASPAAAQGAAPPANGVTHTFPDPSISLIEFSDQGLCILLAGRTERDTANRRLVLKKVAHVRLGQKDWGGAAFPEIWIQQNKEGLFLAIDPASGKIFRHPSRRRYEIAFLSKDVFECGIQCLKERRIKPLYELLVVAFASRAGFSVEAGCLLAPDDYAAETTFIPADQWVSPPPPVEARSTNAQG